jgi:hypothetical protein
LVLEIFSSFRADDCFAISGKMIISVVVPGWLVYLVWADIEKQ